MPQEPQVGACDNLAARGVLLAHSQGIGIDETAAFERTGVALGMHMIAHGLAAHAQPAGEHTFGLDAALNGLFHHSPHLMQIIPDGLTFATVNVFPRNLSQSSHTTWMSRMVDISYTLSAF